MCRDRATDFVSPETGYRLEGKCFFWSFEFGVSFTTTGRLTSVDSKKYSRSSLGREGDGLIGSITSRSWGTHGSADDHSLESSSSNLGNRGLDLPHGGCTWYGLLWEDLYDDLPVFYTSSSSTIDGLNAVDGDSGVGSESTSHFIGSS